MNNISTVSNEKRLVNVLQWSKQIFHPRLAHLHFLKILFIPKTFNSGGRSNTSSSKSSEMFGSFNAFFLNWNCRFVQSTQSVGACFWNELKRSKFRSSGFFASLILVSLLTRGTKSYLIDFKFDQESLECWFNAPC